MSSLLSVTHLVYGYDDASIPPEYHRSYTITVSSFKVELSVNSYGEVLYQEDHSSSQKQFNTLLSLFQDNALETCQSHRPSNEMTGGSGQFLLLRQDKTEVLKVYLYDSDGHLPECQIFHNIARQFKALIPNLQELTVA